MKVGNVSIENFLIIEKAVFSLLSKGLILLQGDNQDDTSADSNGSGKSSLVDAIYWCLWNQTPRNLTGDDVVRRGSKFAQVKVELIGDDDTIWTVNRERRKAKGKLTLTMTDTAGVTTEVTQGTEKLTQALIEKMLGSSEEVFRSAVMIGQEAMVDLASLTDKKLKEIIEEAAGVAALEEAYRIAREDENLIEKAVNICASKLDNVKRQLGVFSGQLTTEDAARSIWLHEQARVLNDIMADIANLARKIDRAKNWLNVNEPNYKHALNEITVIDAALDAHSAKESALRNAQDKLGTVNVRFNGASLKLKTMVTSLVEIKSKIDSLISSPTLGAPCEECGTVITEDHTDHIREATKAKRGQLERDTVAQRATWDAARGAVALATQARDEAAAAMGDVSALTTERVKHYATVRDYESHLSVMDKHNELIQIKENEHDRTHAARNPHDLTVSNLSTMITNSRKELEEVENELQKLSDDLEDAKQVTFVYSPKGVRAEILDEVTPYLNDRTSAYLSILSDGNITAVWSTLQTNAKGELKERFAIDVNKISAGGSFASLSGGEKRKVRLACALALQDLVASRATKPFHLWIGDEIESGLDSAGLERLMMVLTAKASDRGTVIVISHSDLRDWIDNVWVMRMSGGKSELVI